MFKITLIYYPDALGDTLLIKIDKTVDFSSQCNACPKIAKAGDCRVKTKFQKT